MPYSHANNVYIQCIYMSYIYVYTILHCGLRFFMGGSNAMAV